MTRRVTDVSAPTRPRQVRPHGGKEGDDEHRRGADDHRDPESEVGLGEAGPREEPGEEGAHRHGREDEADPSERPVDRQALSTGLHALEAAGPWRLAQARHPPRPRHPRQTRHPGPGDGRGEEETAEDDEDVERDVEGEGERREVLVDGLGLRRLGLEVEEPVLRRRRGR